MASTWRRTATFSAAIFTVVFASDAVAHVKWFAPYDLSLPPRPIGEVITPAFIYMFCSRLHAFMHSTGSIAFFIEDIFFPRR